MNRKQQKIPNLMKRICFMLFVIFLLISSSSAYAALRIQSRSAVVMDASTGKLLYAKNPYLKRAPASTTKLVTAMIALDTKKLSDVVRVSRNAARVSPHRAGFRSGDTVTIENLLYAALLDSGNDAAVALAEAVAGTEARFVKRMNRKVLAIGARNTRFINASGLPGRGQYTTAFDLGKIMSYALRYPKLKEIIGTRVTEISTKNGNGLFLKNSNKLLWSEDDLVGGKTGYTRSARHCFVCAAERNNSTIVVAILGSPNRKGLWKESEALIARGFDVIKKRKQPEIYFTGKGSRPGNNAKASVSKSAKSRTGKVAISNKARQREQLRNTKKRKKAKAAVRNRADGKSVADGEVRRSRKCTVAERTTYDGDQG